MKIKQSLLPLYRKYGEVLRYLISGVLTTAVSFGTYTLFTRGAGLSYYKANVISWICAVLFAYVINKAYVFQSKKKGAGAVGAQMAGFFLSRLLSLGLEMLVLYIMVSMADINDLIAKVCAQVIVVIANYLLSKLLIFRS